MEPSLSVGKPAKKPSSQPPFTPFQPKASPPGPDLREGEASRKLTDSIVQHCWPWLAAGTLLLPLAGSVARAADTNAPAAIAPADPSAPAANEAGLRNEVETLRDEVKELRALLKANGIGNFNATTNPPPATQEELNGVRSDVQTLRDQLNRSIDSTISPNNLKIPTASRPLAIYGTLQVAGVASDNNNRTSSGAAIVAGKAVPGTTTTAQGFKINNLILGFQGLLWHDFDEGRNVFYNASIAATSPNQNNFNISPLDVYLGYNLLPTINPEDPTLSIQAGQQVKQFGVEATAGEAYVTTINRASFVSNLGLSRDVGALVNGTLFVHDDFGANWRVPLVQYSAGVFNGAGQNALNYYQKVAPNGRLVLNAPVDYSSIWRGLSVGGSYYGGYATNNFYQPGRSHTLDGSLYGADLSWVHSPFGFTAEFVTGDYEAASTQKVRAYHPYGYVATFFYQWGQKFEQDFATQDRLDDWFPRTYQPFIRYERYYSDALDAASGISENNTQDIYTLGFNWFFARTTKLQLNYRYINNSFTNPKTENQFLAQFQFGF